MWSFDMGCCANCAKVRECPDAPVIQKSLRNLLDQVENNQGGSRAGIIIVACKERE